MSEILSQDTGFDGLVLHLDASCESVEGAFSRFILGAHGIRWFKSATRHSGWMTENLSQDTGFIGPVRKVMESMVGSIDVVARLQKQLPTIVKAAQSHNQTHTKVSNIEVVDSDAIKSS
ncbi:hypothetical protein QJS10_CPB14g01013 [Acorus calamus]|uniref:Uncharacterized protein n=1 Tax=Acorus calamus TaxID=4465 RepID=A0AAV9DC60_ACOCL|nr:hypothetical protein QJS10_CPB14g01013 [Acorus calamus]